MPEVHLSLSFQAFITVSAALCSIGLAYVFYRVTVPPVSSKFRYLLMSLRAVGIFLLFSLLGDPLLSLISRTVELPAVALLVDNSRSMSIQDPNGDRKQSHINVLQSNALKDISTSAAAHWSLFGSQPRWLNSFSADSLTLHEDGTDISNALKNAKEHLRTSNLQAIILISDGISTSGTNPLYEAEELGLPLFAVGVGDTSEQKDVLVRKALSNDITYIGNRVPVNVTILSSGYSGQRVEVLLKDDGKVVDRKILALEPGTREYDVPLSFVPEQEGVQKYTVEVSNVPGELTGRNNRSTFFTKVLRSKMRVLIVGGGPSQDVSFLRRAFEADKNFDVRALIERGNGAFYEGSLSSSVLNEIDCVVLVGFPSPASTGASVSTIGNALRAGTPALFLPSRTLDYAKLRPLEALLPFGVQSGSGDEFQAFFQIVEAQQNNPILKLSSRPTNPDGWSKLPPLFKTQTTFRVKPESEILAISRIQTTVVNDPFLLSRNIEGKKSLAFLGYGLWRWSILSDAGPAGVLEPLMGNAIRWLTTREDERQARVQPSKQTFTTQEPVEFRGQVYDESYQPIENAQVSVTVQHGRQMNELTLSSIGNGRYEGSISQMEQGDYRFTANITVEGKQLLDQQGRFSVGGMNVEFLETRMNKPLLQLLANRTGGKYYDVTEIDRLPNDIKSLANFQTRELTQTSELELWNLSWILGLVVLIFSVEWFLRKRNGML